RLRWTSSPTIRATPCGTAISNCTWTTDSCNCSSTPHKRSRASALRASDQRTSKLKRLKELRNVFCTTAAIALGLLFPQFASRPVAAAQNAGTQAEPAQPANVHPQQDPGSPIYAQ